MQNLVDQLVASEVNLLIKDVLSFNCVKLDLSGFLLLILSILFKLFLLFVLLFEPAGD